MGTRADFYVGTGKDAEWIGSVAWDGYEWGERIERGGTCPITSAKTEEEFRAAVTDMFSNRDDVTTPDMGWPWPWEDSCTTDCAYCFLDDKVLPFGWGAPWSDDDEGEKAEWPDMSEFKAVAKAGSNRSGVIAFSA